MKGTPGATGASSPEAEQDVPRLDDALEHEALEHEALEHDALASARVSAGSAAEAGARGVPGALPPLDEIRQEHVAYVRTLVSKLAVSPTYQREDLVQEVLIQAHRSKHSPLDVRALLFGITRHVVYRWIANNQQEQAALASHEHHTAEDAAHPSAEDDWQAAERRDVVRASIEELPEIFREVFVRVEVEEMSMPETAKDLGIPINTGYTRLHLARARFSELLRRLLARRHIDKEDLALPVIVADLSASEDAARSPVSTHPHAPSSPGVIGTPVVPRLPALSRLPHLPWGATELLLFGGAVAVSVAVSPPDAAPLADVVAEPQIASASVSQPIAAPSPTEPPATTAPPSGDPPCDPPRDPSPAPSTLATTTVTTTASSPRPTSPAAPSSPTTIRSDGAWARDIAKLALAGDRAGAAAELAAFRKAYPNSTYITRLEGMVVSTPPRPSPSAPATSAPAAPSSPSPGDPAPR